MERQNLASVTEFDSHKDGVISPPILFKGKASPRTGFLSALKKENRSRSNSSVVAARRYSTESILGDRLDSIGRRLSRDLMNSPPDLSKRLEHIGKYGVISSGRRFTSIGLSKSNETLSEHYGSHEECHVNQSSVTVKPKKAGKRPKITFECYERDKIDDCIESASSADHIDQVTHKQASAATMALRDQLHAELRSNYSPLVTKKTTRDKSTNLVDRPPIPQKVITYQRQKSLDNLDMSEDSAKTSPNSLAKVNQRSQMSLERLSREDLLRLSHSSQSEIHEYLKGSSSDHSSDMA